MKILQLKFKNLNSLYGDWQIDFTEPNYLSDGIFALTGPTGAGKSTILDAICLALYGATPRLGKVTKNNNDIMSRQTGECYAEVVFESSEGRFRCHWSQHRARKKPDGKLAESKHEISDARTGDLLESKKREVAQVIEAKTGMDFERFTRSILLAQGGFDTFLKADTEQKSKILEQITGTEIYSQISQRCHEKLRQEKDQLALLEAEISGITLLTEEEQQTIEQDLKKNKQQHQSLSDENKHTQQAIHWLNTLDNIRREINTLETQSEQLAIELNVFIPRRDKLKRAIKASYLDSLYAPLKALRNQMQADEQQLKTECNQLPQLEQRQQSFQNQLKQAEQVLNEAKKTLLQSGELFNQVRALDQNITNQQQVVRKLHKEEQQNNQHIQAETRQIEVLQNQWQQTDNQRQQINTYLQTHEQDQWLISGLAGIEAHLNNLMDIQKTIQNSRAQISECLKARELQKSKLENSVQAFEVCQSQLKEREYFRKQQQQAMNRLLNNKLLREYEAEKEALLRELALLKKIASLEDERQKLQDNKPCPLCGSLEHPYALDNVPVADETEQKLANLEQLINDAHAIETQIKQAEQEEKSIQVQLSESEKQKLSEEHELKTIEQNLHSFQDVLEQSEQSFNDLKDTITGQLKPLGISTLDEAKIPKLLKDLQQRLQNWQSHQQQVDKIAEQLQLIKSDITTRETLLANYQTSAKHLQKQIASETERLQHIQAERQNLFADKDPDKEEAILRQAVNKAEATEVSTRDQFNQAQQDCQRIKTTIHSLEKRVKQNTADLQSQEQEFKQKLLKQGFADEAEYVQASLSVEQRESLNKTATELDNQVISLQSRLKDRREQLDKEEGRQLTSDDLPTLTAKHNKQEEQLSSLIRAMAEAQQKLEQHRKDSEKIKQKQAAIEAQKVECQRWEKLHTLIGSSDGKKYRNFAQGLTFELMVSHANRQLKKMSDRYLLIRDRYQPLELNVIDNYQAGEIRSVRNLSGGETFIVSLTLALGLSKMASRKVSVDSLFLDEGFGSLDEEALENALEALASLHQDGKLIGIISHVPALKERINTQIEVKPLMGGKSIIKGPGCTSDVSLETE